MQRRTIRLLEKSLTTLQWCFAVAAAWVLVKATILRDTLPYPTLAKDIGSPAALLPSDARSSPDALAAIWERDLRQELIPKPPEKKPEPKAPPAPPPVVLPRLLATFVEDGKAWGLFVELGGSQRVKAATNSIDGFTITAITPGHANLEKAGKTYTIEIPRPAHADNRRVKARRN